MKFKLQHESMPAKRFYQVAMLLVTLICAPLSAIAAEGDGSYDPTADLNTSDSEATDTITKPKEEEKGRKPYNTQGFDRNKIAQWVNQDQAKRGTEAQYFKYGVIDEEFLSDKNQANLARIGLFKALNHTAINAKKIYAGEDASENQGIVFAIDVRKLWGPNAQIALRKWNILAQADRSAKSQIISVPVTNRIQPIQMGTNYGLASRIAFNALYPDIYNQLIDTPGNERDLQKALGISFNACEVWVAQQEAIVYGPRISCMRRTSDNRIYWATSDNFDDSEYTNPGRKKPVPHFTGQFPIKPGFRRDFSNNGGSGDMAGHPGATTVASEAWVEMLNGFVAYYVWGNVGQERGRAELFVADPDTIKHQQNGGFRYLETGRSCVTCHLQGVQAKPSDVPKGVKEGKINREALQYWTDEPQVTKAYAETRVDFLKAMKELTLKLSDGDDKFNKQVSNGGKEPTTILIKKIDGDIPNYIEKYGYKVTTDKDSNNQQNSNNNGNEDQSNSKVSFVIGNEGLPVDQNGRAIRSVTVQANQPLRIRNSSNQNYTLHITNLCGHPNIDPQRNQFITPGSTAIVTSDQGNCVPSAGQESVYRHGTDPNQTSFTLNVRGQ